jgi:hypothetical protein
MAQEGNVASLVVVVELTEAAPVFDDFPGLDAGVRAFDLDHVELLPEQNCCLK